MEQRPISFTFTTLFWIFNNNVRPLCVSKLTATKWVMKCCCLGCYEHVITLSGQEHGFVTAIDSL